MASFSFARQPQPAAAHTTNGSILSFGGPRSTNGASTNDPLQPLRTMADRVGKEVEKFAERVDHWHTHGNDTARAKYQTTVKMVGKFRDVAETHVKELKRAHAAENQGELDRSVRRRIQSMTDATDGHAQSIFGQSLQSNAPTSSETPQLRSLRNWQAELATWELVRIMIEQHQTEPGTDPVAEKQERLAQAGGNRLYSPSSEIWDRFLISDDQAQEKAVVLRWLEQTARNDRSDLESITAELEGQSGKGAHTWTNGWLDTKSKIKQAKRLDGSDQPLSPSATLKTTDRMQDLVTQLDPDAPVRQKRALEKSDDYYERALWMVCYEMLRRGMPWKDVCEWAQERNEAWRGVSVGAAYEAHPNGGPNLAGPTVGYLFRRMCFYAARGARIPYEGAVYGLLSGDLKQVQAVCQQSWDDHLHAHYNALLLSRFDTYLQQNHTNRISQALTQKFVFQDAVANIGDWNTASRKVIGLLKQQKATAEQAITPIKLIQSALIEQNLDELLIKVGTALADMLQDDPRPVSLVLHPDGPALEPGRKPAGEERKFTAEQYYWTLAKDPHAFRILVHISIAYRRGLGALHDSEMVMAKWMAMDNVVATYIEFLRISKRISLIPLYAAQLEPERAAHCLARVIPDIKNTEEQRRCVALLEQYRIDVIEVIAQSFSFAFGNSGFTHFELGETIITNPIDRFRFLERTGAHDYGLWPGYRIQEEFPGSVIEDKEEAIIEALQWYHYVSHDYKQTFSHLRNALLIFLLNGRFGAAEKVVNDLSLEALSLSRTEALCGYPFDFTQPGAEEQDEATLFAHRATLVHATRQGGEMPKPAPSPEKHAAIVARLREASAAYCELQQIVRILAFFRDWRHAEEELIKLRKEQPKEGGAAKKKENLNHIRELLENIEIVFTSLISSISESTAALPPGIISDKNLWNLQRAYLPEIVLAYLSVLQTAAFFQPRDSATSSAVKAMEIANLVADEDNEWLQRAFLETGRMSELVDALAQVSKAMLRLNEHEPKKVAVKKRGSKGETLRIWDLQNTDRL